LADLGGLDEPTALAGLADSLPDVRACVVAAAGGMLGRSSRIADSILRLAGDADPQVRFQVALALGNWDDRKAGLALAQLARRDGQDPWMRAAMLSSAAPHMTTLLANLIGGAEPGASPPSPAMVESLLALAGSLPDRSLNAAVARSIGEPAGQGGRYAPWQFAALAGLMAARDRSGRPPTPDFDQPFTGLWEASRRLIQDDRAVEAERLAAVRLLGHSAARSSADRDLLVGLLRPQVAISLQQAAVAALGRTTDPKTADLLVHDWKGHSPQVRSDIVDILLTRSVWTASFLSALEDGCVPAAELDPARRQRLLSRRDPKVKARAEAVFAHQAKPRQAVVDSYRPALGIKGDQAAGAAVFKKLCASCHRLAREGVDVGPDLAALNDKSAESMLIAILDPNRAFEAKFASFTVATVDGRVLNGVIASESATSLTLRRQDGKEDVLLRSEIQEMAAAGQSLMPEGLEKDLKPRDLADLIAFLASSGASR
jgi:putative heme-binding domain-containing protein